MTMLVDDRQIVENVRKVLDLIEQDQTDTAYRLAKETLDMDPTNKYVDKLYLKCAKLLRKKRKDILHQRLSTLKSLWKEQNYYELRDEYSKLNTYYPGSLKVIFGLNKLSRLIKSLEERKLEELRSSVRNNVKNLRKQGKYLEAVQVLEENRKSYDDDNFIDKLRTALQHEYVHIQLKETIKYIEKGEYEKMYKFLTKLYIVFPEKRVKFLIEKAESMILEQRKYEKRLFIKESLELANALLNESKYEDCMKVCEELNGITQDSHLEGNFLYKKAKKRNEEEMNNMLRIKVKTNLIKIKNDYKANKEDFIVI